MATNLALPALLRGAQNLPSPPGVAVELLRLTESEEVTIDALAATISRDPALAARKASSVRKRWRRAASERAEEAQTRLRFQYWS